MIRKFFKFKKYRVKLDNNNRYHAEVWRLWFPVWVECFLLNTSKTLEEAKG